MRHAFLPIAAVLLPACSSTVPLSIDITTGQETTAFTDAPPVVRVDVTVTSPVDSTVKITASSAPGGTFDLGDVDDSEYLTITATGYSDEAGTQPVMTGQSLGGLLISAVNGDMPVFIQRNRQWARPPGGIACSHVGGVVTVKEDRALLLTGGKLASKDTTCDPTAVDSYDFFALTGDATAPAFNPVPQTIVSLLVSDNYADSTGLIVAGSGWVLTDYSSGEAATPQPVWPSNVTVADIAGGAAIPANNGRWFVVGGTRAGSVGSASAAVLEVDADGTLTGYALSAPRQGAAAAWVDGTGLVVVGGSKTAPAVELLGTTATNFETLPYPPEPRAGAGAVVNGSNSVLVVGGVDASSPTVATQTFDLGCTAGMTCAASVVATAALPVSLQNVTAYQLALGIDLVVGDEPGAMGMTRSFVVDLNAMPPTVTEAVFKEPRRGAVTVPGPTGSIALVGGEHGDGSPALSVELFSP